MKNIDVCCSRPCSGLVVSGYSKREKPSSFETLIPALYQYKNFKKMYTVDESGEFKGWSKQEFFLSNLILMCWSRFRFQIEAAICKDLLLFDNFWPNWKGQSSKICGSVVSYWRHHGTLNWVLPHQWSRDSLLCYQEYPWNNENSI